MAVMRCSAGILTLQPVPTSANATNAAVIASQPSTAQANRRGVTAKATRAYITLTPNNTPVIFCRLKGMLYVAYRLTSVMTRSVRIITSYGVRRTICPVASQLPIQINGRRASARVRHPPGKRRQGAATAKSTKAAVSGLSQIAALLAHRRPRSAILFISIHVEPR
jgi:hypothetical protein